MMIKTERLREALDLIWHIAPLPTQSEHHRLERIHDIARRALFPPNDKGGEKSATEKLNLSIAGIESNVVILETMLAKEARQPPLKGLLDGLKSHVEQAREHLLTIQFHLAQLR